MFFSANPCPLYVSQLKTTAHTSMSHVFKNGFLSQVLSIILQMLQPPEKCVAMSVCKRWVNIKYQELGTKYQVYTKYQVPRVRYQVVSSPTHLILEVRRGPCLVPSTKRCILASCIGYISVRHPLFGISSSQS